MANLPLGWIESQVYIREESLCLSRHRIFRVQPILSVLQSELLQTGIDDGHLLGRLTATYNETKYYFR